MDMSRLLIGAETESEQENETETKNVTTLRRKR